MKMHTGASVVSFILIILNCSASATQTLEEDLDEAFKSYRQQGPGVSVTIAKDGTVIYAKGFGLSNLDYDVPNTPDTVFDIGSMAKQFTAACIAILIEEGKLSLHDDIRIYVPEIPDYGKRITIDHLLHHTSGIRSYETLMALAGLEFAGSVPAATAKLFNLIATQNKLDFDPGDKYSYSNSNYFLLAVIVERVSGETLPDFAQARIFDPLGMKRTFFNVDKDQVIENRAIGYVRRGNRYEMMHDFAQYPVGARGVNSTVLDMTLWQQNLIESKVGGADFRRLMLAPGKLNDGRPIPYAFGLEVKEYRGLKTIGHGGFTGAFHTYALMFPDQRMSVVAMSNGNINSYDLIVKAAELCLAGQFKSVPQAEPGKTERGRHAAEHKAPRIRKETSERVDLADYVGTYVSEELLNATYRLVVKDGELTCLSPLPRVGPLNPEAPLKHEKCEVFSFSIFELHFVREDGEVTGFRLDAPRARGITFVKQ